MERISTTSTTEELEHYVLAMRWCRYNGQRGTCKQAEKVMRQLTHSDLVRMLAERGIR